MKTGLEMMGYSRGGDVMPARNKKNFRPTEKGAGMTRAGVAAYRRANPGSKLKTAVTGKVKKGSKAAMIVPVAPPVLKIIDPLALLPLPCIDVSLALLF